MNCPSCGSSHISYPADTNHLPVIEIQCEDCGTRWNEPNHDYIEAELDDRRNDYYDQFGGR